MNDFIDLPPLPVGTTSPMIYGAYYCASNMHDYALAAIEADRLKREDYINDDRDTLRAEIVALRGTIAALESQLEAIGAGGVTQGQRLIEADRQQRGEPVGYARKDQLNKVQRGWSHMCQIQPEPQQGTVAIYTDPQHAEPPNCNLDQSCEGGTSCEACQPAAPVKVPSDDTIREVFLANGFTIKDGHDDLKHYVYAAARALLARYGQPAAPASDAPCSLGVGCEEYGVCYAEAHNQPEQCGRTVHSATPAQEPSDDAHRKLKERTEYLLRGHKAIFNQGPKKVDLQKHIKTLDAENDRLLALLARYGQSVEPEGWQLVPKEPSYEMVQALWSAITDNHDTTDGGYKAMLAAAPKFGEEE